MKKTNSTKFGLSFKNAVISEEDGVFKIVETSKKGEEENSLTDELRELLGIKGLNISISIKDEL